MGAFGAVVGAVVGGVAGGISSFAMAKKNANAYKDYAKSAHKYAESVRDAAEKYSGQNAYNAMQSAADTEGNVVNQNVLNAQAAQAPQNNTNKMANAANLKGDFLGGYNLGSSNQSTKLDSAFDTQTANARNDLTRAKTKLGLANTDYKAGMSTLQGAMNTAGGLANLYSGMKAPSGQTTSDERVKTDTVEEYDNHSDLPKADVDDAFRRIESINYKYKPETGLDSEEHTGVTAQSVEGTAFDDMVSENPQGTKQLDKQRMQEAIFAGIASMRKELDELEGKTTSDETCKQNPDIKDKAEQAETLIENQQVPTETLPKPLQQEANQIGGSGNNDEVNNEAISKSIEEVGSGFLDDILSWGKPNGKVDKQQLRDELDSMSTADMRDIAEMGGTDNPYMPEETTGEIYGDDYKALAPTNGTQVDNIDNLPPAVIPQEPSYTIEELDRQPMEVEEQPSQITGIDFNDPLKQEDIGGSSIGPVSNAPDVESNDTYTTSSVSAPDTSAISAGLPKGAITSNNASVNKEGTEIKPVNKPNKVGAVTNGIQDNKDAAVSLGVKTGNENNGALTSNSGYYNSGAVSKDSSLVYVESKLPVDNGETHTQEYQDLDLEDAAVQSVEAKVRELPIGLAESLGFDVGSTVKYNKQPIEDYLPEVEAILSDLGV